MCMSVRRQFVDDCVRRLIAFGPFASDHFGVLMTTAQAQNSVDEKEDTCFEETKMKEKENLSAWFFQVFSDKPKC